MTVLAPLVEDTAAWLTRAANGEVEAFGQIVRRHHDGMVRVAYLIARDVDLADEAVQAAWAIAWRKLHSVREPDRLRPWLISVAANETRNLVRRRNRRSVVELAVADAGERVDRAAAAWAADLDLGNALARLDAADRASGQRGRSAPGPTSMVGAGEAAAAAARMAGHAPELPR